MKLALATALIALSLTACGPEDGDLATNRGRVGTSIDRRDDTPRASTGNLSKAERDRIFGTHGGNRSQ